MPIPTNPVDGMFYIDRLTTPDGLRAFYLRENGVWSLMGYLVIGPDKRLHFPANIGLEMRAELSKWYRLQSQQDLGLDMSADLYARYALEAEQRIGVDMSAALTLQNVIFSHQSIGLDMQARVRLARTLLSQQAIGLDLSLPSPRIVHPLSSLQSLGLEMTAGLTTTQRLAAAAEVGLLMQAALTSVTPGPSYTYNGYGLGSAGGATYPSYDTITGIDLGAEAADRYIIISLMAYGSFAASFQCLLNGSTMTAHVTAQNASGGGSARIMGLALPTGTTGTLQVRSSTSFSFTVIGVYSAYGLSSTTPTDTGSNLGGTAIPIDISPGGFAVAAIHTRKSGSLTYTWTGANERFDLNQQFSTFAHYSGADTGILPAGEVNRSILATPSVGSPLQIAFAVASFR